MVATSAMEKEISTEMTGVGISLSEKILSKCKYHVVPIQHTMRLLEESHLKQNTA